MMARFFWIRNGWYISHTLSTKRPAPSVTTITSLGLIMIWVQIDTMSSYTYTYTYMYVCISEWPTVYKYAGVSAWFNRYVCMYVYIMMVWCDFTLYPPFASLFFPFPSVPVPFQDETPILSKSRIVRPSQISDKNKGDPRNSTSSLDLGNAWLLLFYENTSYDCAIKLFNRLHTIKYICWPFLSIGFVFSFISMYST